jgi:hypothetical protein
LRCAFLAAIALGIAGASFAVVPEAAAEHPNGKPPSAKPMSCYPKQSRFAACGSWGGLKLVGFQVRF